MSRIVGIFIGVNHYRRGSGFQSLRFCDKDAVLMQRTLEAKGGVQTLFIESGTFSKEDMDAAFQCLTDEGLTREDVVVFHFAGHGFAKGGVDYLAFSNSSSDVLESCLAVSRLITELRESGAGRFLLLLDCCRNFITRTAGLERFKFGATSSDSLYDGTVYTGCRLGQTSQEHEDIGESGNGVFTAALCTVLSRTQTIAYYRLQEEVAAEARALCGLHNLDEQEPQLIAPMALAGYDILSLEHIDMEPRRRLAVLISGPTESGKTTMGRLLQDLRGFTHLEMSQYVKRRQQSYMDAGHPPMPRQDFVERVIWGGRQYDAVAQDALAEMRSTAGPVVVTGARRPEEIEALRGAGLDCVEIYLHANSAVRWSRLILDNDDFWAQPRTDFVQRNLREFNWGLASVGIMPDCRVVINEEGADQAAAEILRIVDQRYSPGRG